MIDSFSACGSFRNILSSCPNLCNLVIYLPSEWGEVELNNLLDVLQSLQRLTRLTVGIRVYLALIYSFGRLVFQISHIWKYYYRLKL